MNIQATQSNSVQQFSALNAFKTNKSVTKPAEEEIGILNQPNGTTTSSAKNLMENIDVNAIRECARSVGEYNLTDDDIKYGLLYGRSVIAEWLC